MLNDDYKEMLQCLAAEGAEYLLVGAYAMAAHGYPRATMDMDLWVSPSPENAAAVIKALRRFGAPLSDLTSADLQHDDTIFQIGVAPRRIDVLTGVSGLRFEEAFANAIEAEVEGIALRIPSIHDLIRNKKASGRKKDLADVEALEELLRAPL
jgi:hypothetical protein